LLALALFLALVALAVTMVERLPGLAASEPVRVRDDDELVLRFGTIPERIVPTAAADDTDLIVDETGRGSTGGGRSRDSGGAATHGAWYVVQRGDTLTSIALEQLGSAGRAAELARINSLANPDDLRPGDRIRLR
jgi:hypothetical protein